MQKEEHAMAGHVENSIVIDAPMDLVWRMTNDVESWPTLFSEYADAKILERDGETVRFRLTMHPDEDGNVWSWISERTPDAESRTVLARRLPPGPFEYMHIRWTYADEESGGVRMTWIQDFHMHAEAPADDATMQDRLDAGTKVQMPLIKRRVEEAHKAAGRAPRKPAAKAAPAAGSGSWRAESWAEFQEEQTRGLIDATLDALDAKPGMRILDVGCGSGLALELALARGAVVAGTDATPALLELAKRRLPYGVDLPVGDLENLPFEADAFDAVMSYNALRYAADPVRAIKEFARVVRPHGLVAIGGWGDPPRCETTVFLFAVLALYPERPHGAHEKAANSPEQVRAAMRGADLHIVRSGEVSCPFVYPDLETAWRALGATELVQGAVALRGESGVREVFDRHFAAAVRPDGSVRQENVFEYAVGVAD
jgi:aromatase